MSQTVSTKTGFSVVLISSSVKNSAPYFLTSLKDQTAMCTFQSKYQLPQIADKENNAYSVIIDSQNAASSFIKLEGRLVVFNPGPTDDGQYEITLKVQQNSNKKLFNLYTFQLNVVPLSMEMKDKYELQEKISKASTDLKAKIIRISREGEVFIQFEKSMYVYANFTLVLNESLTVQLLQRDQAYPVRYEVTSFKGLFMTLKLNFGSRTSSISQQQLDSVQIIFKQKDIYLDSSVSEKVKENYSVKKYLPSQISDDLGPENIVAQMIKVTMATLFGVSVTVNIFVSQGAATLWGMIEGFQLITHLPMMSINLPFNTLSFFAVLNDIVNMNLVDLDDFSNALFDFASDEEYSPFNPYFEFMNYTTSDLIQNLGLMFYAMFLNILVMALALLILLMGFVQKSKVARKFYNSVIYNSILRFFAEAQLELTICSLINLNDMKFNYSGDIMSSLICVVVIMTSLILPFLSIIVIREQRKVLKYEQNMQKGIVYSEDYHNQFRGVKKFIQQLSVLTENMKYQDRKIYYYALLYWIRRSLYSLIMIVLPNDPQICLLLHILICLLAMMFVQITNPIVEPSIQKLMIFNETIFMLTCYSFLPFLNLSEIDNDLRITWGYFPIILILFYLLFNSALIVREMFQQLSEKLRPLLQRCLKGISKTRKQNLINEEVFIKSDNDQLNDQISSIEDRNNSQDFPSLIDLKIRDKTLRNTDLSATSNFDGSLNIKFNNSQGFTKDINAKTQKKNISLLRQKIQYGKFEMPSQSNVFTVAKSKTQEQNTQLIFQDQSHNQNNESNDSFCYHFNEN